MASEGKNKAGAVGLFLAVVLLAWACDRDEPATSSTASTSTSSSGATIASVETFADVTLSDGRRIHNTLADSAASTVISSTYEDCLTGAMNRWAKDNLVGRQVGNVQEEAYSSSYSVSPMAGYSRARLYLVNGSSNYYDVGTDLNSAQSSAYSSCVASTYSSPATTTTEPAPTTTTEPPVYVDTDPDVYVDADAPSYDTPKRRTGNSGHPCLPGERDGDGDGYCGEGR